MASTENSDKLEREEGNTSTRNFEWFISAWSHVPDIILEQIYSYLTIRERYYASLVCKSWYRAFKLPNVWSTFTLKDTTLTRGKYNYYSGWQYVLDDMRTSTCLNKVGKNIKSLVFEPTYLFNNLYAFMNMMSWYIERQGNLDSTTVAGLGTQISHLKFTFPCNMANKNDLLKIKIYGTGGQILASLKRLTRNLKNLKNIEYIDLMLDNKEALYLLDEICINCTNSLRRLVLINATKIHCPLLHVGVFLNLQVLVVSPQNLDDNVLELIGHTKLQHMHIVQNQYSPSDSTIQLPRNKSWMSLRKNNPRLKVHFEIESNNPETIILPMEFPEHSLIPCNSIVLENSKVQVPPSMMLAQAVNFYSTLAVYAIKGLSKYYQHRNFSERMDEILVRLCRSCPNIHTLMTRDKISTSTILEIVSTAKSLRYLYVRRNVVLKRCDRSWLIKGDWTPEHENWIRTNCNSYENTEQEVSKILKYRWHMLSEKEFTEQKINLHI